MQLPALIYRFLIRDLCVWMIQAVVHYKFTAWIKSYDCNVGPESVRVSAMTYDKDGNKLGEIDGLYTMLNEESEPSEWRELILGVYSDTTIAYVRPFIEIAAGSMNLWIDDLEWNIYNQNDEYLEDFNSVRDDGTPDGWSAEMVNGTPGFISGNSVVTIEAKDEQDIGLLKSRWDTALEYTSMTYTTTYAATEEAKAKITIKFYDYNDKEIEKARIEKVYDATAGEYIDVSFDFMLTSAKYMMIELGNEGKGSVSFEGIRIVSENDSDKSTTDDITWRGKWVWHNEDYKDSVNSTPRYFRYHFTLPDAAVRICLIQKLTEQHLVFLRFQQRILRLAKICGEDRYGLTIIILSFVVYVTMGMNKKQKDCLHRLWRR